MIFYLERRVKNRKTRGFNIAPLVDVVFLLLIFFVSSSRLSKISSGLAVNNLPQTKTSPKLNSGSLTIYIFRNRKIGVDGNIFDLYSMDSILAGRKKDEKITLLSDKTVPVGYVISVIGEINRMGFVDVSIGSTLEK